jgi:hypothetical protein
MELSLKNYKEALPAQIIKLAQKNTIRECDEIEKGAYIAFVDEGEDSYDVAITVLKNGSIANAECDCKSNASFCRHATALLLFIAGAKKEKKPAKTKIKINKSDALLEDTALHELKEWVKNLLQKNPDIELAFVHHFSARLQQFTPEEIEKITNDAVKAVVKNKKIIDLTQLKNIVGLWADIHAPIVQQYQAGAADENMFNCFHALINCCMAIQQKLLSNSKRAPAYIDSLLKSSVETIANIYDDTAWAAATGYFINHIPDNYNGARLYYLQHLQNIISVSSDERKKILLDEIVQLYTKVKPYNMLNRAAYTQKVFDMVQQQGMFEKYYAVFKPVEWSNEYNEKLIALLIDLKQYTLAKKYCDAQVAGNYREDYNLTYWVLLKKIYLLTNNENGLADVLGKLFPYTFGFDDYLFIASRINNEEEKKQWRTKMLNKARRHSSYNNISAIIFCFQLADYEKRYKKMIDYIDSHTPYSIILQYFEPMALTDKTQLLQVILRKHDEWGWGISKGKEENTDEIFPALYQLMARHFTPQYLKAAIDKEVKSGYGFRRPAKFIEYMMGAGDGE